MGLPFAICNEPPSITSSSFTMLNISCFEKGVDPDQLTQGFSYLSEVGASGLFILKKIVFESLSELGKSLFCQNEQDLSIFF